MKMKIVNRYKLKSLWENVGIPLEDYVYSKELEHGVRPGMLEILANDNPPEKIVDAFNMVFAHTDLRYRDPIKLYKAFATYRADFVHKFIAFKKITKENMVYFLLNVLLGENQLKLMYERKDRFERWIESRNRLHAFMALNEDTVLNYVDNPKTRLGILEHYLINRKVCEEAGGFSFKNYVIGTKSLKDLITATYMSYRMIELKTKMDKKITDDDWSTFFDYVSETPGKIRKRTSSKHLNAINAILRESIRYLKGIRNEEYLKRAKKGYNRFRAQISKHKLKL